MSKYDYVFLGTTFTCETKGTITFPKDHLFCIYNGTIKRIIPPEHDEFEFILKMYQSIHKLKYSSN